MQLEIAIYQDGENAAAVFDSIMDGWRAAWQQHYSAFGTIVFLPTTNVKVNIGSSGLPPHFERITEIRNPDLFFYELTKQLELGGIEITEHSPDGSNVEKRYPFIWSSRREGVNAFVACPYSKTRPGGQVNRLPFRHSHRNWEFLQTWNPYHPTEAIQQIVPVYDVASTVAKALPSSMQKLVLDWSALGAFFAHVLASKTLPSHAVATARHHLIDFRTKLVALAEGCKDATSHTEASTLLKDGGRWIQTYNTRPDSGHWERGEGQFDSVDGRLMFTLDAISLLPLSQRPTAFEFWLPQLCSSHPWVVEQKTRGFGSKRFRNICRNLSRECQVRFADDLSAKDWELLQKNPRLLLERLDYLPGIYKITSLVPPSDRTRVASLGIKSPNTQSTNSIARLLNDENLFFSSHRAYKTDWLSNLVADLRRLPSGANVLLPRLPKALMIKIPAISAVTLHPAESCAKEHLLMLRQIHRVVADKIKTLRGFGQ